MITNKPRSMRNTADDYEAEDTNRNVLGDKERRHFSMTIMDHDPTGLSHHQKQILCDAINRGESFDGALEIARSTTDTATHRSRNVFQAIADSDQNLAARKELISNRWRDPDDTAAPEKPIGTVTSADVERAIDRRNARLENAWKG